MQCRFFKKDFCIHKKMFIEISRNVSFFVMVENEATKWTSPGYLSFIFWITSGYSEAPNHWQLSPEIG